MYGRKIVSCAVAQAVSRRPLTAEARVLSRVSPCGICGGQSGAVTSFPLSISFHWCSITLKNENTNHLSLHLHHRVAQEASRLRCVSSFCCGALPKKKYVESDIVQQRGFSVRLEN